MNDESPLWRPSKQLVEQCDMHRFQRYVHKHTGLALDDYAALYQWSIEHSADFWSLLWDFCDVIGDKGKSVLEHGEDMEQAVWFGEARLNFAENLLRERSDATAIRFRTEDNVASELTFNQLYDLVAATAAWLELQGVRAGDRVAGCLPNMPETIVAMLAATSLGAVWTSTSPDFGAESIIDRFGQTAPKILFFSDGYYYGGKAIDIRDKIRQVQQELYGLVASVEIPLLGLPRSENTLTWREVTATPHADTIAFRRGGFNDPLYIMYSSGTTGKPKCITHKAGGVLLQHLKEHRLHSDIRPGDRVFYFTTCGWMMWNWLVSALASRAAVVLYDGSPFYPDGNCLWDYAESAQITLFGTSAKYIDALKKAGLKPRLSHRLDALRTVCSTGSVLAPESFDYVYDAIKQDVNLASISGGTDIVSCFVLGNPILPVYRGESQCRGLGMAVEVYDDAGNSLLDQKGELVCSKSFPSQPAFFWGDEKGDKYHDAYFARFPGVWHHGDYVRLTRHGGVVIYGRSDATLNPGGVRIGTAEIYRHVEQLDEVQESIAIGQDWDNDVRVVLFVVLTPGYQLNDALRERIRKVVRAGCTPRHVPARIIEVAAIPRTKSGKIVELAVREVVHNRPVKNIGALANPEALAFYRDLEELKV